MRIDFDSFFGKTVFEIWGKNPEDFINLAVSENLEIWEINRENDGLSACCRPKNKEKLEKAALKTGAVFTVKNEYGAFHTLKKYRLRYGLLTGVLFLFLFVFIASRFLWKVNVTGLCEIDEKAFSQKLSEYGICVGGKAKRTDLDELQLLLLRDFDRLAFVSLNIKGSVCDVEVTERRMPPEETVDRFEPCNIVASLPGYILDVNVLSGNTLCKKYDTVKKGEILVGGIFDSKFFGFRFTHAAAKISALVQKEISAEKYFEYEDFERTGKKETHYTLNFLGIPISFFNGRCKFENFEEETNITNLKFENGFYLPMSLEKTDYYETKKVLLSRDEKKAEEEALFEAEEKFRIFKNGENIENYDVKVTKDDKKVKVTYYCYYVTDIAAEKKIFRS